MKTVLAAIDFSRVSRTVVLTALTLARGIAGRVVLLHVVPPPAIATDLAPLVGEVIQFTAEIERASRRHLRRIQTQLASRGFTVETICQQGAPVPVIVAHAKEQEASYIVLGAHGHSALYDLVVGSTASGVLKRAPCPVVVVPAVPSTRKRRTGRRSKSFARV